MTAPVITSLGLVTPLATGRDAFVQAWREGASAAGGDDGLGVGALPLREHFPEQRNELRRMDRLSKLLCMAAALARADGGFGDGDALLPNNRFGAEDLTFRTPSRSSSCLILVEG